MALKDFAESLTHLTWQDMDKIAVHIAEDAAHALKDNEEFDPRRVATLLVDIGEGIAKEIADADPTPPHRR